ncbi:LuxR C-terminal-related transcriptional regulator [Nocardia stercoris]|uniref:LuxR C-terminal-related transcriptional regulator n=1 Tax=Nocardia stercoris TaxID=2483361 RepID=UPI001319E522|nr:LuxR C-terminal-related transcriptional regulator [Nocardia stercoris]
MDEPIGAPRRELDLGTGLGELLRELAADATALLDREFPAADPAWARTADALLRQLWDETLTELIRAAPDRIAVLTALLDRIRSAEHRIADLRARTGTDLLRGVRQALGRLHDATSVDELLTRAPEELSTLGFGRTLVSTVDESVWNLHTMHVVGNPRLAAEMVAAGRSSPRRLDGTLVESDVVARARPGLVFDVQRNPRVDRQLVRISQASSYAIAPLVVRDTVIGLVHGDCYPYRDVDATDRAVLDLFGEGLGHAVARLRVLDGLADLRRGMERLSIDANIAVPQPVPVSAPTHPLLSAREAEVAELLAAGEPNRLIARTLSISEGTVKTHVTHILRKLGAANRAEAVAYWLRQANGSRIR